MERVNYLQGPLSRSALEHDLYSRPAQNHVQLQALTSLTCLSSLWVRNACDGVAESLAVLSGLLSLKDVRVSGSYMLTDEGLQNVTALTQLTCLGLNSESFSASLLSSLHRRAELRHKESVGPLSFAPLMESVSLGPFKEAAGRDKPFFVRNKVSKALLAVIYWLLAYL